MRRESVLAKGMSLVPNARSVKQASMDWRVLTHMDVNSASVMDTLVCVRQPWVILDETFQISSLWVWMVGQLSMNKVTNFADILREWEASLVAQTFECIEF